MNLVANARMYAVTPGVRAAWQALFGWLADASGVPLTYIDHAAPAPLETLWSRNDLGAAFMCGFPFSSAAPQPHLIAVPVPSPVRYGGLPRYCTDFVVRADHPAARLSDTFGQRLGWTVEHSQSGYNAVRHHLLRYRSGTDEPLFAEWIGPLVTPRRVIDAVVNGDIEVGPLDSWVHDLLKRHEPAKAAMLRTIESTAMTPIPPLVAAPDVSRDNVERLRRALLAAANDAGLGATLDALLIAHFVEARAGDYVSLLEQLRESDRAGVPSPGAA